MNVITKYYMKHNFILKVAFIMLLTIPSAQLRAQYELIDGINYYLNDKEATLTSVEDNSITSLEIPATVEYNGKTYNVTEIRKGALNSCSSLTSLSIQDSDVPLNVEDEYYRGYHDGGHTSTLGIKIKNLYLGRDLITKVNYSYYSSVRSPFQESESTLTTVSIGPKVKNLCDNLFYGMGKLTVINLANVKTIGEEAFAGCDGLRTVNFDDALDSIGESAFLNCTAITNLTFPSSIKSIGNSAFKNCTSITSISFPKDGSLKIIGNDVFSGCKALTAFKCPNTVESIGSGTFKNCAKLVTVSLSQKLDSISSEMFAGDISLTDMTVPDGVTRIGNSSFSRCTGIVTYSLPSSLTSIGTSAFYKNTSLVRLTIPGDVREIGKSCVDSCTNLTTIRFDDGDAYCNENAFFQDCLLRSIYR